MRPLSMVATTAVVLALGMGMSHPAQAVTQARLVTTLGAEMCKLSVPTIDSKVRPRASGFRNEGTTNQFVICTLHTDNGPSLGTPLHETGLLVLSIDGAPHDVQCTGVNSFNVFGDQQYITKNAFSVSAYQQLWWGEQDFGVDDGSVIPTSGVFSITCILPPNTGLDLGLSNMTEDVGT